MIFYKNKILLRKYYKYLKYCYLIISVFKKTVSSQDCKLELIKYYLFLVKLIIN